MRMKETPQITIPNTPSRPRPTSGNNRPENQRNVLLEGLAANYG